MSHITIYKDDVTPPSRAVMMVAEELALNVKLVDIALQNGEHMTPEYLKKNPLHSVPLLEDGDFVIDDSHAIAAYLVTAYGKDDTLCPKDSKKRAILDQRLHFDNGILYIRTRFVIFRVFTKGMKKSEITSAMLDDIEQAYGYLEAYLAMNEWLAGDHMTIADICTVATLTAADMILPVNRTKYPKTIAWWNKLAARPSYKKYIEPGNLKLRERFQHTLAFNNMSHITIYKDDVAPPSRAVMMVAEELGLNVKLVDIALQNGEHMTPEYLKKNPLHSVPLLEDGDFVIDDSHAIAAYLVTAYGKDDTLCPKDPKKRAILDQRLHFDNGILYIRTRFVTFRVFLKGMKKSEITSAMLDDIEQAYGYLEAYLAMNEWLAGDHMTIADICTVATLTAADAVLPVNRTKYPKTIAWWNKLAARPSYKKYNEPGNLKLREGFQHKLATN